VIEVKSKLTSQELKDCIAKGARLASLDPLVNVFRPFPTIFAFKSDLKGGKMVDELQRYTKLDSKYLELPAARIICVANKGYAYFDDRSKKQWKFMDSDSKFSDVANFLGGFTNTLPDFRRLRNSIQIPYGRYMLDSLDFQSFGNHS
jgi:hypothetical protein